MFTTLPNEKLIVKHSFTFIYAEEGYSTLNQNVHTKKFTLSQYMKAISPSLIYHFLVSVDKFLVLIIIMPDYNEIKALCACFAL